MRPIKQILFYLLLPVAAASQTVHVDDNRIAYKGKISIANAPKDELYERAKVALFDHVKGSKDNVVIDDKEKGMIAVKGDVRLTTPYGLVRKVEYVIGLAVEDGGYKYRIDSVTLVQHERGEEVKRVSSEKMLKAVDVTGPESGDAEAQLNELDMNLQKLLALIKADMKKTSVAKNTNGSN